MERTQVGERYRLLVDVGGEHPQQVTGELVDTDYDETGRTAWMLLRVESSLDPRRVAHERWYAASRVVWLEDVVRRPEPLPARLDALLRTLSEAEVDHLDALGVYEPLRRIADGSAPTPTSDQVATPENSTLGPHNQIDFDEPESRGP